MRLLHKEPLLALIIIDQVLKPWIFWTKLDFDVKTMKMLRISRSPGSKSFQKVNGINKWPYLPLCTSYMKKKAQAVERASDGKIIMLGYPTCGKEKMVWYEQSYTSQVL